MEKNKNVEGIFVDLFSFLSVKFEGRNNNGWIKISEKLR